MLIGGGGADLSFSGTPASFSFHLASSTITPAGSMLCDCDGDWDVMDVVFSVCIVRRGAVGARVIIIIFI